MSKQIPEKQGKINVKKELFVNYPISPIVIRAVI